MSMWVLLVGVGQCHMSAIIALLCYCTHPHPYLISGAFLVLVLIIVQLHVVCVCTVDVLMRKTGNCFMHQSLHAVAANLR